MSDGAHNVLSEACNEYIQNGGNSESETRDCEFMHEIELYKFGSCIILNKEEPDEHLIQKQAYYDNRN